MRIFSTVMAIACGVYMQAQQADRSAIITEVQHIYATTESKCYQPIKKQNDTYQEIKKAFDSRKATAFDLQQAEKSKSQAIGTYEQCLHASKSSIANQLKSVVAKIKTGEQLVSLQGQKEEDIKKSLNFKVVGDVKIAFQDQFLIWDIEGFSEKVSARINFVIDVDGSIKRVTAEGNDEEFNMLAILTMYLLKDQFGPAAQGDRLVRNRYTMNVALNPVD